MSKKNLMKIAEESGFMGMISSALKASDAILTGALGVPKLQLLMIPGRLVQAARNKDFLSQLAYEFEELIKTGRVKNDIHSDENYKSSLQELLAALEDHPVDQTKFNLLKSIFIKYCSEDIIDSSISPYLIMSISRTLSTGEIILLAAIIKFRKKMTDSDKQIHSAHEWLERLSENSNFSGPVMVEYYERLLIEKNIISARKHIDNSGIIRGEDFRLTDLGLEICKYLEIDFSKNMKTS